MNEYRQRTPEEKGRHGMSEDTIMSEATITTWTVYEHQQTRGVPLFVRTTSGDMPTEDWIVVVTTPPCSTEADAKRWYEAYRTLGRGPERDPDTLEWKARRAAEAAVRWSSGALFRLAEKLGGWQ